MAANISTFSITDAILLRMLPVKDPGSLFRTVNAGGSPYDVGGGTSYPLFTQMQSRTKALADLMAYQPADFASVSINSSAPQRIMQQTVSGNYFDVLGVGSVQGRLLSPEVDQVPGQHPVAVVSYRLWKDLLNRRSNLSGSKLNFGDHIYDIIGVASPQFFGVEVGKVVDVWTPIAMASAENLKDDHAFWLRTMGRLKPGVTIARAVAPMQAAMSEFMLEDVRLHAPPGTSKKVIAQFLAGMQIKGVPAGGGISSLRSEYQRPLQIMLFLVALVMLIACSNVGNLLIAQGSARQHEIAIRFSLGAGRSRIVQQFLTEGFLLAILAAVCGLMLAGWATPAMVKLLTPSSSPAQLITHIDIRLTAATLLLIAVTVLLCGLLPALWLSQYGLHKPPNKGRGLPRKILLTAQVALSLVLVVGAGLFTRTLINLLSSHLGFNPANLLVTRLTVQPAYDRQSPFPAWNNLLQTVRSLPGIEYASLSSSALFSGEPQLMGVRTTNERTPLSDPVTGLSFVSSDCFSTLGIPFIAGRDFESADERPSAPAVAIVNRAFTRKFFGDQNPLGKKLTKLANAPDWTEIIGIVQDAKVSNLREDAAPMIYVPFSRIPNWIPPQGSPGLSLVLQVRGHQNAASLTATLRQPAASRFLIDQVYSQQQLIGDTLIRERLLASLATLFGAIALLLAGLGLYGVVSHSLVLRRKELGIRVAVGATPVAIISLMLRDSAFVAVPGITLGLLASFFCSQLAKTLLYGLAPNDASTFVIASLVLLAGLLSATLIPAYRASRTDPIAALRHD